MALPNTDVLADLLYPWSEINRRHLLTDILTAAVCGVISGATVGGHRQSGERIAPSTTSMPER